MKVVEEELLGNRTWLSTET